MSKNKKLTAQGVNQDLNSGVLIHIIPSGYNEAVRPESP